MARRVEILRNLDGVWAEMTTLSEAEIVKTNSNLTPEVLRRMLYLLGFSANVFEAWDKHISRLVAERNSIAHGARMRGFPRIAYMEVRVAADSLMTGLGRAVLESLRGQAYRRFADNGAWEMLC
jgi:hypothetical protein